MTRQYLIGEVSVLLGQLQEVTQDTYSGEVARLRREVEGAPVTALGSITVRALRFIERLSRESLDRGDAAAFAHQSTIGAELRDFGICAGLFDEMPRRAASALP